MTRIRSIMLSLFATVALAPIALSAAPESSDTNDNVPSGMGGAKMASTPAGISNHGHFVCTAGIRANGSVFSGEYVNAAQTTRLGTGTYQVSFSQPCPDVRIALGWFRICQPDTLTWGTLPSRTCIVADRAGNASAIWVRTFDAAGNLADTPFTLSVSR